MEESYFLYRLHSSQARVSTEFTLDDSFPLLRSQFKRTEKTSIEGHPPISGGRYYLYTDGMRAMCESSRVFYG